MNWWHWEDGRLSITNNHISEERDKVLDPTELMGQKAINPANSSQWAHQMLHGVGVPLQETVNLVGFFAFYQEGTISQIVIEITPCNTHDDVGDQ